MLIDSHCHLNLLESQDGLDDYLLQMKQNQVGYALCIGTRPDDLKDVVAIADKYPNIFATVGIHPDGKLPDFIFTKDILLQYLNNPKVIGIGETGLDYYHSKDADMTWQHDRFKLHIEVAVAENLPLVIHTRNSVDDTISILRDHQAAKCGAVMHCFTESLEHARQCLDLGFYISISGIVTFKNAVEVQELAKFVPLDRLLIETDSPYLAPMPFRGKQNHPALVKYTGQYIADLRGVSLEVIGNATSNNFFTLFKKAKRKELE
jgi:TatD DNase family protein